MYRYRVRFLADKFEWPLGSTVKNQIIALFKPNQTLEADLSKIFSNYSDIENDFKAYAQITADDLFSDEEIIELMKVFGEMSGVQIMVRNRVKLPILYSNSGGISSLPEDRNRRYVSFKSASKLSFPLQGLAERDNHFVHAERIERILSTNNISNEKIKELLLKEI